ncbi:conserved hypothetical protein [Lodderomyces elongisporus NRRL YB-4239]|uniref:TOG domain-containing protein n=1 Tax=Lodderomyces elongisporus (strain ATCC 11503 / CBS 2605 / JCM 1781 / NBRC 1676 / NRRL YB-4239) TaxID=379508 RepID=A5E6R8_LODEL|nr:conserved hypothetical protein [Lodderomyces elongisporus NRRL YB-4239]
MDEEIDPLTLPFEERIVHKVWKVRLGAYEELSSQFKQSPHENDPIFNLQPPDLLKRIILDSNVVAQETGYKVLIDYLQYGGTPQNVLRLVKGNEIIPAICEKGLSSSRKGTKDNAIESILLMLEILQDPAPLIEQILPSLTAKLPKLVAGCTTCLATIYENFGCKVIAPKLVIPSLSKLFAHADRNVRAEATKLTVELYKWMREGLSNILFPELKPVQQKDLTAAFEKVKDEMPMQKRLTKQQKEEIVRQQEEEAAAAAAAAEAAAAASTTATNSIEGARNHGDDIEMADVSKAREFDPLEFVDPVEVLSKFPTDFHQRVLSAKWKDRVEVLEEVLAVLNKHPKLVTSDDYAPLIRIFAKNMKDANIQVVQLSANCTDKIANALGSHFTRYQSLILMPVIERTKEKKPSVAGALDTLLDTMFSISSLGSVLDETIEGMKLKVPQNKIACANYLRRCLANTTVPPKHAEVDSIVEAGVKLLSESQEPIRQAATELIGTLMKITGERQLSRALEKVDDIRKTKILKYYQSVEVKCSKSSTNVGGGTGSRAIGNASASANASANTGSGRTAYSSTTTTTTTTTTKKFSSSRPASGGHVNSTSNASTIPAKRTAVSPAKRLDDSKVSNLGKGLTARSLAKPTIPSLRPPQNHANSLSSNSAGSFNSIEAAIPSPPTLPDRKQEEIDHLKAELQKLHQQHQNDKASIAALTNSNQSLQAELAALKARLESENRNNTITINHKETQINNLRVELEKANYKIKNLEQENEITKLQQSNKLFSSNISSHRVSSLPIYNGPDLSSGVKRLSIGGDESQLHLHLHSLYQLQVPQQHQQPHPQRFSSNGGGYVTPDSSLYRSRYSHANREIMDVDSGDDWKRAAEVTSQLKARIERMKARARATQNVET